MIELVKILPGDKALVRSGELMRVIDINGLSDPLAGLAERFDQIRPPIKPRPMRAGDSLLRVARRKALRKIADEITAARDRGFAETDKYIPSKGLELSRQADTEYMVSSGAVKDDDLIWARNWWTGHQEQITVATWKAAMLDIFKLRQLLKQIEQAYRDEVEVIFTDESKPEQERIAEIEQIKIPSCLDIPEQITTEGIEKILHDLKG